MALYSTVWMSFRLIPYGPEVNAMYLAVQDLKDLMRRVGDVCFADAHKDRRNEG